MAKTQAEKEAFLRSNRKKVVLVELKYHDGTSLKTEYLANAPYISEPGDPGDTYNNTAYDDAIVQLPTITENDFDDATFGRLVFVRQSHMADWLDYSFDGHPIKFYMGQADWSRYDFFEVFSGISGGISAPDSSTLALEFFDKREFLQAEVQQSGFYSDRTPYPICIGPVFNATARMIDKTDYTFRYHENGNLTVSRVRDRGVDLGSAFTDNGDGTFTLDSAPTDVNGADITFDVDTGETDGTFAEIVKFLALRSELTESDLDLDNFAAFGSSAVMARFVSERTSIQSLINEAAASVNALVRFNLSGKMELVKRYEIPSTQVIDFDEDDVLEDSLRLVGSIKPIERATFTYKRNETTQSPDSLAGAVSEADRAIYTEPHQSITMTNGWSEEIYPNLAPDIVVNSWLVNPLDVYDEVAHFILWRNQKRNEYSADFVASPFLIAVGDGASLIYSNFGFSSGKNVVITGRSVNLDSLQTRVTFIV